MNPVRKLFDLPHDLFMALLSLIVGTIAPGFLLVFIWDRELFMSVGVAKLTILSLMFILPIYFIEWFIVPRIIFQLPGIKERWENLEERDKAYAVTIVSSETTGILAYVIIATLVLTNNFSLFNFYCIVGITIGAVFSYLLIKNLFVKKV